MRFSIIGFIKTSSLFLVFVTTYLTIFTVNADYPKSGIEKEIDQNGSIFHANDGSSQKNVDAVVEKNNDGSYNNYDNGRNFKKKYFPKFNYNQNIKVNVQLYRASIKALSFADLAINDPSTGTIVANWYYTKGEHNMWIKFKVEIKNKEISDDAISVSAYQRKMDSNHQWGQEELNSQISNLFRDKIIYDAKVNYLSRN